MYCHIMWLVQDTIKFFFRGGAYTLADILPQRFGPANLLTDPNAPLLLQPQHHNLDLTAGVCLITLGSLLHKQHCLGLTSTQIFDT